MAQYIRKNVAQQIVETVKDVSGHDINFIDKNGSIFASTDPARVGDFHEVGLRVVKTGDPIEVETDDSFPGTHRGVNLPVLWYGELIAAIGISGSPDEVRLASDYPGTLKVAVGCADTLMRQNRSFETAKIALLSLFPEKNFAVYDDLDFDILLGSISEHARNCFLEKTALSLTEADRELLETYFNANMSLKAVSETLFMHKNTIQYKLDKIAREVGYNPRIFQDAVVLYLALKMMKRPAGASSARIEL